MDSINNKSIRVAVIGASGYGGIQSIRLLKEHPDFEISFLGGYKTAGLKWNDLCPFLPLENDPTINAVDLSEITDKSDIVLLSLPNGISSQLTPKLIKEKVRVVDLSADYRYRSLEEWKSIYSVESSKHSRKDELLCSQAVYGIPEWNSIEISKAKIVACPGCFPTASLLPLMPFLKQGIIETDGIIIDSKSGTSGGGRVPKEHLLLAESSESVEPYSVVGHRHTSEIEQELSNLSGSNIQIQFTPHLVPMVRGLLSTVYARLRDPCLTAEDCKTVLETVYRSCPSVEIQPVGVYPKTKWVRFTNKALISVQVDQRNGRVILMSAIDNLIKGQAGQAIQSLNLMSGLPTCKGLPLIGYYP
ncbi:MULTISPECIES: N-acetyl-gamma-glutamyl-phosphate reductase [Prochlorococcus]|uniref:N-acetyl-gamma-glutamyl-phosphate reductase n=1 Tax=Prochlorococcus marinus (strain SARG / CCMP1375 / SS120) TaxID=167539 RepID=ARGC_PROMA|nr:MULTISPECIES: N-acetyl-gamma-glutamyl-phosphate reductase [Prochlorococcus]Q7VBZ8.1 RecName: Full=N-acetyl-gamma-glutamyl-phosphate reductase; Short=AGPR; AltName: Full=N-acetyl-glutamate semialdehyde dehydrogenase; Short=NAGSA dehydrogenase [Prochlorococcus marinus subsp. marinus str. CCMP1375]AAP99988.1 Acetylglutamate semialdehyde dehydrogenase [Prochlorococcus marinus subsp. marinus str. CCMP1375]KGG13786.1 N-acetyl-gamma-glutamyl-phosphate reductase [Prochlorococcus marinus str. LG]KGG1